jgi:RNA polymerase sigma factor (sigma-70 family)
MKLLIPGEILSRNNHILLQLLERSGPKLCGILTRLTLDELTAEELMQDVFARLCEHKNLDKIENIEAYAVRCAVNLAFDWRRQKRSLTSIPEGLVDPNARPPHLRLTRNEQFEQILDAAGQLEGMTRQCFVLRHIEQMDYDDIASQMQKSNQQVRGLCSKGLAKIRQILNTQNTRSYYKEAINE